MDNQPRRRPLISFTLCLGGVVQVAIMRRLFNLFTIACLLFSLVGAGWWLRSRSTWEALYVRSGSWLWQVESALGKIRVTYYRDWPGGLAAVALAVLALVWMIPRSTFLSGLFEHFTPGLVPSSELRDNLKTNDPDLVRESLGFLDSRKDPAGVSNALPLLQSQDDYIWLNAALYTGACGRQEAVPYLIKALRHTAWRADPDTVTTLTALTGQNFGNNFSKWQAWWITHNPDQSFDWTSHLGFAPRVPATKPK